MTRAREMDKLTVRDMTLPELLENMEEHLSFIINHRLPLLMDGYRQMAEETVTDPEHMIRVYGKENGIPPRYVKWLLKDLEEFKEDNPDRRFTTYDITQMFSALAHHEKVQSKPGTVMKLQGAAAHITDSMTEDCRCGSCRQLVPN
jgi:hypothetical protein